MWNVARSYWRQLRWVFAGRDSLRVWSIRLLIVVQGYMLAVTIWMCVVSVTSIYRPVSLLAPDEEAWGRLKAGMNLRSALDLLGDSSHVPTEHFLSSAEMTPFFRMNEEKTGLIFYGQMVVLDTVKKYPDIDGSYLLEFNNDKLVRWKRPLGAGDEAE